MLSVGSWGELAEGVDLLFSVSAFFALSKAFNTLFHEFAEILSMARPVTLFTGQWADLKLEQMARMTKEFGYDGIELACWGDHFEVDKALADDGYCAAKRELLDSHGFNAMPSAPTWSVKLSSTISMRDTK